jgi:hypothetical protein
VFDARVKEREGIERDSEQDQGLMLATNHLPKGGWGRRAEKGRGFLFEKGSAVLASSKEAFQWFRQSYNNVYCVCLWVCV